MMQTPVISPYAALMANHSNAAFLWHHQQQPHQQPPQYQQQLQSSLVDHQRQLQQASTSSLLSSFSHKYRQLPMGSATISPISPDPQPAHQLLSTCSSQSQPYQSHQSKDARHFDFGEQHMQSQHQLSPQQSQQQPPEDEEQKEAQQRRSVAPSTKTTRQTRTGKPKRVRTIFTPEQLARLETEFDKQMYLVGDDRIFLATSLGLAESQVKVWFQNRRIKFRKLIC